MSGVFYKLLDSIFYRKGETAEGSLRQSKVRWLVLFLCCLSTMGGYYCHDALSPLQTAFKKEMGTTATQFNFLVSAFNLPNTVFPVFGGIIIDKLGIRFGYFAFALLACFSQVVVVMGTRELSYNTIFAGTACLGVTVEAVYTAKSTMVVKWFSGQELALAMGLTLTVSRLGSSLGHYLSPTIYEETGDLVAPFQLGIYLAVGSFLIICFLCLLDSYTDSKEKVVMKGHLGKEEFHISDIKNFKPIFYLVVLNCMTAYACIRGFLNNATDLIHQRFGYSLALSGKVCSMVFIISAFFSPVFGALADRFGKRTKFLLGAFIVLILVHAGVAFMPDSEEPNANYFVIVALVGVGFAFAAYASIIWPSVSLVVEQKANGTAFGFTLMMQNIMLSVAPLIIGKIHDNTEDFHKGYFWTEIFLLGMSVLGVFATIAITIQDAKTGSRLECNTKEKRASLLPERTALLHQDQLSTGNHFIETDTPECVY